MIVENGEGYQENEVVVFEDFGGKCNLRIDGVNENGGVTSLHIDHVEDFYISGHREIEFSSMEGKGCKIVIELADTKKKKVLPKNIKTCSFSRGVYYVDFEYEIPEYIEGGQIKIYRPTCTLDKKNLQDLEDQIVCIAQRVNHTPKMQIAKQDCIITSPKTPVLLLFEGFRGGRIVSYPLLEPLLKDKTTH